MKAPKLSIQQWYKLREQLLLDYPKSVITVAYKTKEVLGFTVRIEQNPTWDVFPKVYLDFFDEKKRSFFLLKYSEYFNGVD